MLSPKRAFIASLYNARRYKKDDRMDLEINCSHCEHPYTERLKLRCKLRCSGSLCRQCLVKWVMQGEPLGRCCPTCQNPLYRDERDEGSTQQRERGIGMTQEHSSACEATGHVEVVVPAPPRPQVHPTPKVSRNVRDAVLSSSVPVALQELSAVHQTRNTEVLIPTIEELLGRASASQIIPRVAQQTQNNQCDLIMLSRIELSFRSGNNRHGDPAHSVRSRPQRADSVVEPGTNLPMAMETAERALSYGSQTAEIKSIRMSFALIRILIGRIDDARHKCEDAIQKAKEHPVGPERDRCDAIMVIRAKAWLLVLQGLAIRTFSEIMNDILRFGLGEEYGQPIRTLLHSFYTSQKRSSDAGWFSKHWFYSLPRYQSLTKGWEHESQVMSGTDTWYVLGEDVFTSVEHLVRKETFARLWTEAHEKSEHCDSFLAT